MSKEQLYSLMKEREKDFEGMSDAVWGFAELCFNEYKSTALQREYMEREGFRITTPVARMDTAFIAEYGSGSPVLAILGENDALAGQSQAADVPEERPEAPGANGHACGHNLLGSGSIEAACGLKRYMEANGVKGTLRYYACPAEEGGRGKVYLAASGAFDDVDAAVCWHPAAENCVDNAGLACVTVRFPFEGRAAHAAAEPWNGRSALDAVELLCTGTQYLREHVLPSSRIHYAITDTGGGMGNVVPQHAEAQFIIRATTSEYMEELYARILKICEGAALMTETSFRGPNIISSYSDFVRNDAMDKLLLKNLKALMPMDYTPEELAYAEQFKPFGSMPGAAEAIDSSVDENTRREATGSTDVADVSHVTAISQVRVATTAIGTVAHGWANTAQGKSSIAHKGMHTAARVMAGALLELFTDEALLAKVREDFDAAHAGRKYHTLMPTGRQPSMPKL